MFKTVQETNNYAEFKMVNKPPFGDNTRYIYDYRKTTGEIKNIKKKSIS